MGKCDWTMAEAQAWVREHKDFKLPEEEKMAEEEIKTKDAIPYKDLGYLEEGAAWDGPGETAKAEVDDLKVICAWVDSENPDLKGSYKLPHHKVDRHKAVWNGVRAAMGAVLGARGGVDIPEGDRKGVFGHLSKHYSHWDKEVPEFKDYSNDELKEMFPDEKEKEFEFPNFTQIAELQKIIECLKDQYKVILDEKDILIAELKEGRVLSRKNRQTIKDAIKALQDVLTADEAGSAEEEEKAEKEISVEAESEKAMNKEELAEAIAEALKKIDLKKITDEAVDEKLDQMRGVVR